MALARPGERMVAARQLFGSCLYVLDILARFGVDVVLVDGTDLDQWRAAIRPNTKLIWVETPTNPAMRITDIAGMKEIASAAGALLVVDNTFATPYLQQPLRFGADLVIHSTTKYLGGHSDVIGGAVVGIGIGFAHPDVEINI